ncbi:hypothetical protein NUW58_g10793 [Xylaria curta]|uniref:Uncharacterized protein n=1 Tax=Xylaria curta TaxID=42375 RepID=A0ACC1MGR6_9PEZI|nr:hypothetical protein NUW58_g10793 [Xylaria curta]
MRHFVCCIYHAPRPWVSPRTSVVRFIFPIPNSDSGLGTTTDTDARGEGPICANAGRGTNATAMARIVLTDGNTVTRTTGNGNPLVGRVLTPMRNNRDENRTTMAAAAGRRGQRVTHRTLENTLSNRRPGSPLSTRTWDTAT